MKNNLIHGAIATPATGVMQHLIAAAGGAQPVAKPFNHFFKQMPADGQSNALAIPALTELPLMVAALKAPARPAKKNARLVTLMNVVLDESGSMDVGYQQTMKGYNDALETLRPSADEIGCRVTQVNFSNRAHVIAKDVEAKAIVPLSQETYRPMGGTALFDTVAAVVKQMLSHPLANDDNTSILLSITTDGDDTSSTTWKTRDMAAFRELMQAVATNDRWTVALAGPDTKLREFADIMCVPAENVAAFKPDSVASRGFASDAGVHAMSSYSSLRASGMKKMDTMYSGTVAGATAMSILGKDPHA